LSSGKNLPRPEVDASSFQEPVTDEDLLEDDDEEGSVESRLLNREACDVDERRAADATTANDFDADSAAPPEAREPIWRWPNVPSALLLCFVFLLSTSSSLPLSAAAPPSPLALDALPRDRSHARPFCEACMTARPGAATAVPSFCRGVGAALDEAAAKTENADSS
jgi:hypothetical protein